MTMPSRVAVLGASGYLGAPLTRALARADGVELVLAVSRRANPARRAPKVVYASCDLETGPLDDLVEEHAIDAVVHLAFISRPTRDESGAFATCVRATARALRLTAAAGARRAVLVSSVGVYGPRGTVHPVTEGDALRPNGFQFSRLKAMQEEAAAGAELDLAIVRPCTVVGPPGGNFLLDLLSAPIVPVPAFHCPAWQFLHLDDFCAGVLHVLAAGATGPYNLVPNDTIALWEAVRALGGHPLPIPEPLLSLAAQGAWRLGRAVPHQALDFLSHPPLASGARLSHDTGFDPTFTSRQALAAWSTCEPAASGAAGAPSRVAT